MEKYITNIKDLVILALTNGLEIKAKAESGVALSCFQMGMIHLLGIDTPIDFKKAGKYLGNSSLNDDPDANRLLGFIAECEGNYSQAFKNYAHAGRNKKSYINSVYEERQNLQGLLKKLDLPFNVLNKEITAILDESIKNGDSKIDASIKIAMICNDRETCLEVAHNLFVVGDFFSAKRWLQNGNIDRENPLFVSINEKLLESKKSFNYSRDLQVIDIVNNSLLYGKALPSIEEIKVLCDNAASSSKKIWQEIVKKDLGQIVNEEKEILKEQKTAELAKKEIEDEKKKKLKDKVDTYGGLFVIVVLALSGYYCYSNYSIVTASIIVVVILLICGGIINYVDKLLGLESYNE